MNNYRLYTTAEWEKNKPIDVDYTQFFYNNKGKVTKVEGDILILKKKVTNGEKSNVPTKRKAYFDGFGRCYVGTHNTRKRMFDISFPQKTEML